MNFGIQVQRPGSHSIFNDSLSKPIDLERIPLICTFNCKEIPLYIQRRAAPIGCDRKPAIYQVQWFTIQRKPAIHQVQRFTFNLQGFLSESLSRLKSSLHNYSHASRHSSIISKKSQSLLVYESLQMFILYSRHPFESPVKIQGVPPRTLCRTDGMPFKFKKASFQ